MKIKDNDREKKKNVKEGGKEFSGGSLKECVWIIPHDMSDIGSYYCMERIPHPYLQ